ncbi:hypothetical protein [Sphingobacterium mizutaii]|uniref:hypothetical protein n=1 Tax=Sphingobacterium mizutaii TaxID=1010 RepID=UPI00289C5185|nr:hypothetical protein [Sphingobacterium mizutaii]
MPTIKEQLPAKHKLIKLFLPDGTTVLARAFEGGSGVYSIETEEFEDNRYWCEGEATPGRSIDDILDCKWQYT